MKKIMIRDIHLIIQDGAMLNPSKGMRFDEETAFGYIKQITEAVKKVGGDLTLLWHPNSIIKQDWWSIYLRTLKHLKPQNAWFGSVRKVGEWWGKINDEIGTSAN